MTSMTKIKMMMMMMMGNLFGFKCQNVDQYVASPTVCCSQRNFSSGIEISVVTQILHE